MADAHTHVQVLSRPLTAGSRGRSGVFTARSVELYARPADGGIDTPAFVLLEAFSGRRGNDAPIQLGLSAEDAYLLGAALMALAQMTRDVPEEAAEEVPHALPTP